VIAIHDVGVDREALRIRPRAIFETGADDVMDLVVARALVAEEELRPIGAEDRPERHPVRVEDLRGELHRLHVREALPQPGAAEPREWTLPGTLCVLLLH